MVFYNGTMKKKRHIIDYVFLTIFILNSGLILFFASNSGEVSSDQSSFLLQIVTTITNGLGLNLSQGEIDGIHQFIRKAIGHFGIFFVDGIFGYLTFSRFLSFERKYNLLLALGVGLFIASLSEIIQLFAPERGPSVLDVMLDFSGYLLGVLLVIIIINLLTKKAKHSA